MIEEELARLHEENARSGESPLNESFDFDLSPFSSPEKSTNFDNNLEKLAEGISEGLFENNSVSLGPAEVDDILGLSDFSGSRVKHTFRGGVLLDKKDVWLKALDTVEKAGGHVPKFARLAVERGSVDLLDKNYFSKQKYFKFNGKAYTESELEGKVFKNYAGASEYEEKLATELKTLCQIGVAREVSAEQVTRDKATISPLNFLWDEHKLKGRMIFHWAYWFKGGFILDVYEISLASELPSVCIKLLSPPGNNSGYSKPRLFLKTPFNFIQELRSAKKFLKADLEKAFYQIRVWDRNWPRLACSLAGRYYYICALPMGAAMSVYILQSFNEVACQFYSLSTGNFASVYVDDFASKENEKESLDSFLEKMGYQFCESKRMVGEEIEYVGYTVNLR